MPTKWKTAPATRKDGGGSEDQCVTRTSRAQDESFTRSSVTGTPLASTRTTSAKSSWNTVAPRSRGARPRVTMSQSTNTTRCGLNSASRRFRTVAARLSSSVAASSPVLARFAGSPCGDTRMTLLLLVMFGVKDATSCSFFNIVNVQKWKEMVTQSKRTQLPHWFCNQLYISAGEIEKRGAVRCRQEKQVAREVTSEAASLFPLFALRPKGPRLLHQDIQSHHFHNS